MSASKLFLTGWEVLRAMLPPWQSTQDPLVSYHLRIHKRVGRRPWGMILLGYLTLGMLTLYIVGQLAAQNLREVSEIITETLAIVGIGLTLTMAMTHWRLMIAVSARAADAIAGQRLRGDWDLIAITPVSKTRWFRSQLTTIAWQVFPLVRQLLVVHTLMVLIGTFLILYIVSTEDAASWDSGDYLSPLIYLLAVTPFGLLLIFLPFLNTSLFSMTSLYTSSNSKRVTMSMLYSFVGIYITRLIITLTYFLGGTMFILILGTLGKALGIIDDFDLSLTDLSSAGAGFLLVGCIYCLIGAFFIEWLPVLGFIIMATPAEPEVHMMLYIAFSLTLLLSYVVVPLVILRGLGRAIVWQINQRER